MVGFVFLYISSYLLPTESQWEQAFRTHEDLTIPSATAEEVMQERPAERPNDPDELARAAGSLIDAVRHENNPKFQSSAFLGLMKQLRDQEVVIEGNQMVSREDASSWASDFRSSADLKGKGRAMDPVQHPVVSATASGDEQVRESLSSNADNLDEYFRQENEAYIGYWHGQDPPRTATLREDAEWGRLQRDWDNFEATATGIRPIANYQFQAHNPYLVGEASRHHMMHAQERNPLYDVSH